MLENKYYVGIDGGGTKCKATLFNAELKSIAEGISGPANISREIEVAKSSILDSIQLAFKNANLTFDELIPCTVACAGLAGANITSAHNALSQWQHPFDSLSIISDLHAAALGAHAGKNGSVLVVGTGSCAAALSENKIIQRGGHGFLLGDQGSGAWLGREAITRVLKSIDGVEKRSALTESVFEFTQCHNTSELVQHYNQLNPSKFAQLAPVVISAAQDDDPIANEIIEDAAAYLSTISRMSLDITDGQLALVGGVAKAIKPWLATDIQAVCMTPMLSPEWGAVYYYQNHYQHHNDDHKQDQNQGVL